MESGENASTIGAKTKMELAELEELRMGGCRANPLQLESEVQMKTVLGLLPEHRECVHPFIYLRTNAP